MKNYFFADTHCHLSMLEEYGIKPQDIISELTEKNCPFLLDIGTKAEDIQKRIQFWNSIGDIPSFIHFSAGIWPDSDAIIQKDEQMSRLRSEITHFIKEGGSICAVGECGFDHHWNTEKSIQQGEEALFEAHIALAQEMRLPVIVHSRDAFEQTASCIKNAVQSKGVIHCYSYGKKEAKIFLDLGWHISLSGTITYTKKHDIESMQELLAYIPHDRLLLETDAPYLAAVPHRGKPNTPLLIEFVYSFAAQHMHMPLEELKEIVRVNSASLFSTHE